jgi:hypothetical protein
MRFSFVRRNANGVRVQVFRHSKGRRIVRRTVADFRNRKRAFTWAARRARDGYYVARFRVRAPNGTTDFRQIAFRRRNGRFALAPVYDRRDSCNLVRYATLGRPVFGGRKPSRPLVVRFTLLRSATVELTVKRGGRVVKRTKARSYPAGKRRVRVALPRRAKRGTYSVSLKATRPGAVSAVVLGARRL